MRTDVDRAALVRRSFLELVAERGFHGASMGGVAERAGVATGTTYVHYASKDDLILAVYKEVKTDLGHAAVARVDPLDNPEERFRQMWTSIHEFLATDPDRARFLVQVDSSPYAAPAHDQLLDEDDALLAASATPDMVAELTDLPLETLYELGFGPAVRLAARRDTDSVLNARQQAALIAACWRAISKP